MRTSPVLTLAALLTLFLAGCTISIGPADPFPNAIPVAAGAVGSFNSAVDSGSLRGASSVVYDVSLGNIRNEDLVYLEVQGDLSLRVYDSSGDLLASSTSADFFQAASSAAQGLVPQGITTDVICRGACVIRAPSSSSVFVELENTGATNRNYDFFAFADNHADNGEPLNDSPGTAPTLLTSDRGAIETLGDADYYRAQSGGTLSFSITPQTNIILLEAEVLDQNGNSLTPPIILTPGVQTSILSNELVRVRSSGSRAGPSAASGYTLTLTPGN